MKLLRHPRLRDRVATLYCLGDPNLSVRIRSLHVRLALRGGGWSSAADIGCASAGGLGWGGGIAMTPLLLARYHREAEVVGADIDEALVERNEALARRAGIRNLRFVRHDLLKPSGLDRQDVVILADVVANRPGDQRLIRSASRLVRPGGMLMLHTSTRHPPRAAPSPGDLPDLLGVGYGEDELRRILEELGAVEVRLRRTYGNAARLAGRMQSALRTMGRMPAILFFPVSLLLALPDVVARNRGGDGVLAVARMGGDA